MDSPGNDLESVAGQVASGCNLILFTTGNGSITNFPFVPTLKIMTNSGRFRLLSHEMDFNAGRYLEGASMEKLGGEAFELALQTASGQRSAGERTGQSQVQIWRDWPLQGPVTSGAPARPTPAGIPIRLIPSGGTMSAEGDPVVPAPIRQSAFPSRARDRIGLIVPTSLCAGQVARGIAEELQKRRGTAPDSPLARADRFVALPHTEGCGVSGGESEDLYFRTLSGYLRHPSVWRAVLLEHGCEKTHLDAFRDHLRELGENVDRFGWASIQLDGGLANVTRKVTQWFADQAGLESASEERARGSDELRAGLLVVGEPPAWLAEAFARTAGRIVRAGGTVVLHELSGLLQSPVFVDMLFQVRPEDPTLAYGQSCARAGFHIMESPTDHPVENLTGLGATGVGLVVTWAAGAPLQGSPFLPTLSVGIGSSKHNNLDLFLGGQTPPEASSRALLKRMEEVMRGNRVPCELERGNVDFQITRSRTGFSL
jgi:altronate dehydratase